MLVDMSVDQATVDDLQERLHKIWKELKSAHEEIHKLRMQVIKVECERDIQKDLNDLMMDYILEENRIAYMMQWPCGQPNLQRPKSPESMFISQAYASLTIIFWLVIISYWKLNKF